MEMFSIAELLKSDPAVVLMKLVFQRMPPISRGADFKTSQIEPTHYSIRTHSREAGGVHLRHWVIEGRNEEKKWIQLDERRDNSELNGPSQIATFEIASRSRIRVRILRLRQIRLNHRGDHILAFDSFELFGDLFRHSP
jgi:hypothetical protein